METGRIILVLLSSIHFDTAINFTTELSDEQIASELQYEAALFTTEKQNPNDSVPTAGNSNLKDDRYTTDVAGVQDNVSRSKGFDPDSHGDVTEDWNNTLGISPDSYHGLEKSNRYNGTERNTSAYGGIILSTRHKSKGSGYNWLVSVAKHNCTVLTDPECNFGLWIRHSLRLFHDSDILRPTYNLSTMDAEEETTNISLVGPN